MLLRDFMELTISRNVVIFVDSDEVVSTESTDVVYKMGDSLKSYVPIKDGFFYKDGIDFSEEYETLEIIEIDSDLYEKYGDTVSVIEVYVG